MASYGIEKVSAEVLGSSLKVYRIRIKQHN